MLQPDEALSRFNASAPSQFACFNELVAPEIQSYHTPRSRQAPTSTNSGAIQSDVPPQAA
jgi:hypothetical protein